MLIDLVTAAIATQDNLLQATEVVSSPELELYTLAVARTTLDVCQLISAAEDPGLHAAFLEWQRLSLARLEHRLGVPDPVVSVPDEAKYARTVQAFLDAYGRAQAQAEPASSAG
jgi:hypothetical protein